MPKEHVISLTFDLSDNVSRIKFSLAAALFLFCLFPVKLGSEILTMTTYYPAPYGGYAKLLTTGPTFLARDGNSVGIGTSDLTLPAPNSKAGNLYVNDVYLRGRKKLVGTGEWASRLPITTIYTKGKVNVFSCKYPAAETLVGGGCRAGWRFEWGGMKFKIGPWHIDIPGFKIPPPPSMFIVGCGTEPAGNGVTMWFIHPALPDATTWIACVRNKDL